MSRVDDIEKLDTLRTMIDPADDDDATLLSYLRQAKDIILNRLYPYLNDTEFSGVTFPRKYDFKQVQVAAYLLNKRGAEGETRHIENNISRTYQGAFVPSDLLMDVMPYVGIPR